jgi:hypothetical protein
MKYQEVRRFADLYHRQEEMLRVQQSLFDAFVAVLPITQINIGEFDIADLKAWRRGILAVLQQLHVVEVIGKELDKAYAEALAKP